MIILGIDTSNYTTSLSLVSEDGFLHVRKILDVKKGECGLRQSDALFLHTVNIPELFPELSSAYFEKYGEQAKIDAVAYSAYPRDAEGSYMPCFLAGKSAASAVASSLGVPLMKFSHQAGHIMAALKTCGGEAQIGDEFLALHLSGGTTELVRAKRDEEIGFSAEIICDTADISAGQLIDRAGVMLGLKFPCGGELEKLAAAAGNAKGIKPLKVVLRDGRVNMSGAENRIAALLAGGEDAGKVAYFALDFVAKNVIALAENARAEKPQLPIIFAGGVMRNKIIRAKITQKLKNVLFADVELSSDNAVGTAYLGLEKLTGRRV
jgi:N6-L-threonylcarbamoyladenine synthase